VSQSVGLVPGDEYQLVILDSVDDGMSCGYGDGSAALYTTVDDSDVLITSSNGVPVMISTKSYAKCIVHRIPIVFSIADSARAANMLSQCRMSINELQEQ
jgi:uncharacterized protein (DUF779 family)